MDLIEFIVSFCQKRNNRLWFLRIKKLIIGGTKWTSKENVIGNNPYIQ